MKRLFDILLSLLAIIVTAPVMALAAVLIRLDSAGGIIFRQERVGKDGKLFKIYKFRTMVEDAQKIGPVITAQNDPRITQIGNLLRRTKLDELPQFFNVLKGDMSLVGPRPLLMEYLPLYTAEQARRHEVRPGMTGWAQVNGRNAITWVEKFELDVWYVDHRSLRLDLKIVALTIRQVLRRQGISEPGQATVTSFKGQSRATGAT